MSTTSRPLQWVSCIILLIYLGLLAKNIVFKKDSVRYYKSYFARDYKRYSVSKGWQKANKVPFRTINLYYKGYKKNNTVATYNLLGNLLGFIPFGFLLPLAIPWFRKVIPILAAIIFLSVGFEIVQLYTGLGIFDVDDLILNCTGALAGFILFSIISMIVRTGRSGLVKE